MKRWLILFVAAALFTGCNAGSKDEKGTAKTAQKQTAVQKLGESKADTVIFLNRAEHVWEELYYAAMDSKKKPIREDGLTYRALPSRFDSREKIVSYFSRYWTRPMAERMYDHLTTKVVKGQVYLANPSALYPVLISTGNTSLEKTPDGLLVTVSEAAPSSFASERSITYLLVRDKKSKRYEIKSRTGAYGSEQFE
ncbi:DL-endopeptidase inhibitor IseA family protein [Brevibacillus borstelensis]|uniref:DL-endopeptidase inhibitor IseA family protein n=1 Tax=Brevibacillus borstelensis TaxID=45462 RepID=UPI0030BD62E0